MSDYGIHPSPKLVSLFNEKPYQGQVPEESTVIILGRDANYSENISSSTFFNRILEYHTDGISFWKKHHVHHPFLLDDYPFDKRKGGVKYHKTFAKMNLTSDMAEHISFVELLDVPTIGNTGSGTQSDFLSLVNSKHLQRLDKLVTGSQHRLLLLSPSLINQIILVNKQMGIFDWVNHHDFSMKEKKLKVIQISNNVSALMVYHFSDGRVHRQLPEMSNIITEHLILRDELVEETE